MTDLEEEIRSLKEEIRIDNEQINTIKEALWRKKKNLKSVEDALKIIKGDNEPEAKGDEATTLKTVI